MKSDGGGVCIWIPRALGIEREEGGENVSMSGQDFDTHKLKGLVGNLACHDEESGVIHVRFNVAYEIRCEI